MPACATIGLELPTPTHVGPEAQALLFYGGRLLLACTPCAGRLVPPRRLRRDLEALLRRHLEQARAEAEALRHRHAFLAHQRLAAAQGWVRRIRRAYCTPHHLRLYQSEHLHCWRLPHSFLRALHRQLHQAPGHAPPHQRLRVVFLVPVTGRLRLLDHVAAYLRAPGRCRPWLACPPERVQARLTCVGVLVMVE